MSEFLINFFKDQGVNVLLDKLGGFVRNKKQKAQLKSSLTENFQRFFKNHYEHISLSKEFDVVGLHNFLMKKIYIRVANCFIAKSQDECSSNVESLISASLMIEFGIKLHRF
ncbi:MAG: hypothetical protein ACOX6O_05315 [Christensenellales bacterium]|jgi:hypothetical protein